MHTHTKKSEILELHEQGLRSYEIAQRLKLSVSEVTSVIWYAMPAPSSGVTTDEPKQAKPSAELKRLEFELKESKHKAEGLREKLDEVKAAKARVEKRLGERERSLDHRAADNAALMARLGEIAKQLGCEFNDIEQAIADLTDALAEEIQRREAAEALASAAPQAPTTDNAPEDLAASREGTMSEDKQEEPRWVSMSVLAKELGVVLSTMIKWAEKGQAADGRQILMRDVRPEDNAHRNVKKLVALVAAQEQAKPAQAPIKEQAPIKDDELAELRAKNAELEAALAREAELAQAEQDTIKSLTQELHELRQELKALKANPPEPVMRDLLELLHAHRYVLGESDPRVWRVLYEAAEVKPC